MCGVVGYSGVRSRERRNEFIRLIDESCIRGVHAFGIAYIADGHLLVHKDTELQRVLAAIPDPLPEKIIFHNRYSTSGDYRNMRNNQPIAFFGKGALVFNGTIDMGTKVEMEQRYGVSMLTDNDGEIILRDILDGRIFEHLEPKRSFAGIFLSKDRMFALTNGMRPLWCFDVSDGKFITSTYDIARRAGIDTKSGISVPPYTVLPL